MTLEDQIDAILGELVETVATTTARFLSSGDGAGIDAAQADARGRLVVLVKKEHKRSRRWKLAAASHRRGKFQALGLADAWRDLCSEAQDQTKRALYPEPVGPKQQQPLKTD